MISNRSKNRVSRYFCLAIVSLLLIPTFATAQEVDAPESPRVEVAFVLDTTGSMSGLIEGAKTKIWDIANLIISAEPTPDIRFGLVGYRDVGDEYVTRVFDLTDDIDAIYTDLYGFVAGGGGDTPESVNQALHEAVTELSWSTGDDVLRIIFLVGDAPPHMDYAQDVPYTDTVARATELGIIVNTIQCGNMAGTEPVWTEIASLGGGEYASIGQTGDVVVIATPFDDDLTRLNRELGGTIIGYGTADDRDMVTGYQALSEESAPTATADRLSFNRGAGVVAGGGNDLIDNILAGEVSLDELEEDSLPAILQEMTEEERNTYIQEQMAEREQIQAEIDELLEQRRSYLDEERTRMRDEGELTGFDAEVEEMIREQASDIGMDLR